VWSTLEDTRPVMTGKCPLVEGDFTVPHFDGKAVANKVFKDFNVPTTFLHTSMYMEAFQGFFPPRK